MRLRLRLILITGALLATLLHAAQSETLTLGGTGGALPMFESTGALFAARHGLELHVLNSLGSAGGIVAAGDGLLDLAASARPLSAQEIASGFTAPLVLRTPFVFATSYPNPPSVTRSDIARLLNDIRSRWPGGTAVRIILRPAGEADNALMFRLFPGTEAAITQARQRPDVPTAPSDQDNQELAEQTPGSLICTSYSQTILEHRNLAMLAVDGVAPSVDAMESGQYPYEKRFWLVLAPRRGGEGEAFVAFLRTSEGAKALREAGLLIARE